MKRLITILLAISLPCLALHAQEQPQEQGQQPQEQQEAASAYDVFSLLSPNVSVQQSDEVRDAMAAHIGRNERRMASGLAAQSYRIRIYFDSGQNARAGSEAAAARFRNSHPGVPVSRTFSDPFFKVTVGNYATKADAVNALKSIQTEFPTAFIVRN